MSNNSPSLNTHKDELDFLHAQGFPINPYNSFANSILQVWKNSIEIEEKRDSLLYNIDGMVVKVNDNSIVESAGIVGKTPRAWCAIKFKAEEATTRITDITWQTGRTGKVTPVAELEEVQIAGTTVKRATLHNAKEVIESHFHVHDTVAVRKAGDIIPEVIHIFENLRDKNAETIEIIDTCPECNTKLVWSDTDTDLFCPNQETCPAQVLGRLTYFTSRNIGNIDGLSEKILERFIELYGINDISDIYTLPYEKIIELEGFGSKSVENLQNAVEKSKHIADYKFLAGLGIEGVGPEVAKLICEKIYTIDVDDEKGE